MTSSSAILACIVVQQPMTIIYQDAQGVISVRVVVPRSIERCQNGTTIVRAYDTHREAPRSFTLTRIQQVIVGGGHKVKISIPEETDSHSIPEETDSHSIPEETDSHSISEEPDLRSVWKRADAVAHKQSVSPGA